MTSLPYPEAAVSGRRVLPGHVPTFSVPEGLVARLVSPLSFRWFTSKRLLHLSVAVLVTGIMVSIVTTTDQTWWQSMFSALGTFDDFSGYVFNVTLFLAGAGITIVGFRVAAELRRISARRARKRSGMLTILVVSAVSRIGRAFEIRATVVDLDDAARTFVVDDAAHGVIRVIAHEPEDGSEYEYRKKSEDERKYSHIPRESRVLFLEVYPTDSSEFEEDLDVRGVEVDGYRVLRVRSASIPNTLAAVLLKIRDETGVVPEAYFEWNEGNPVSNMLRFLLFGNGEIAPVAREVLREAEKDPRRRPIIHVS